MRIFFHFARLTRYLLVSVLLAGAVFMTFTRFWLPGVDAYKHRLENVIGSALDGEVRIHHLRARIRGFAPELVLSGVEIIKEDGSAAQLAVSEIRLGIDLPGAVRHMQFTPSWVKIVGAHFKVFRDMDGALQVQGLKATDEPEVPEWLFSDGRFELLESRVEWQDLYSNGPKINIPVVDLTLLNEGERHRIKLKALMPIEVGNALQIYADYRGNVFDKDCCDGTLYFRTDGLQLADFITEPLYQNLNIDEGLGSVELWSEWKNAIPQNAVGRISFNELKILHGAADGKQHALEVPQFSSWVRWEQNDAFWQLDAHETLMTLALGKPWPEAQYSLRVSKSGNEGDRKIQAAASYVDFSQLLPLFTQVPGLDDTVTEWLINAQPKGVGQSLNFFYQSGAELEARYGFCGNFSDLSWQNWQDLPAVNNLSLYLCGTETQGEAYLSAENNQVILPQLPRGALQIKKLEGFFEWAKLADALQIKTEALTLVTPDINATSRLAVNFGQDGSTFLDGQLHFENFDPTRIGAFLPANDMPLGGVEWLDQAFVKGNLPSVTAMFYGDPGQFPFKKGNGIFQAVVDVADTELLYNPAWPNIENLKARARFKNNGLVVDVTEGQMLDTRIEKAEVIIKDFVLSDYLNATGQVFGTVKSSLDFMQHSPQHALIDDFMEFVTPSGNNRIAVKLRVPIAEAVNDIGVDGRIDMLSAGFTVTDLNLKVSDINGVVKFDQDNITGRGLKARLLENPATLDFVTQEGDIIFGVDGLLTAEALARQFPGQIWKRLDGTTDYKVQLTIPRLANRTIFQTKLIIDSDLQGMAVNLPHPLGKTADSTSPFKVEMALVPGSKIPLNFSYGEHAQALLQFSEPGSGAIKLETGSIVLGRGKPTLTDKPGVSLLARLDELHLDAWRSFVNREKELSEAPPAGILTSAHFIVDDFFIGGHSLGRFMMGLRRVEDRWEGQVHNEYAKGRVSAPVTLSDLEFKFDYLRIPDWRDESQKTPAAPGVRDSNAKSLDPATLMPIRFSSEQLLWQNYNLGAVDIVTTRRPDGLRLDKAEVVSDLFELRFEGQWVKHGNEPAETSVHGSITSPNLGQLLENLQVTQEIKETRTTIDYDFYWRGAPHDVGPDNLHGEVNLELQEGRLTAIEPGIGRALGLVNLGAWYRRLRLDFSDLFAEGLAYDRIQGNISVEDSKARTQNFTINAVPANVYITGETNLTSQALDFLVTVSPKSTAALPIAGAVAGGPVIGAAILLAQQLVGEEVDSITSLKYAITGNWSEPVFTDLPDKNGILLRAWNGLMDFPWVNSEEESDVARSKNKE